MKSRHAAIDKHNRSNDHHGGKQHVWRDHFADEQPAKQNGDNRIDVSMRGNKRGRVVLEEPIVGRERHHRAEEDEIGKRQPRTR